MEVPKIVGNVPNPGCFRDELKYTKLPRIITTLATNIWG